MSWWIWGTALVAYGAFVAWYENWRGPLTKDEVEKYLAKSAGTPTAEYNDMQVVRDFLERDDGGEFVMLNVVKIARGEAPHPRTGRPTPTSELMQAYAKAFLPALVRRGGHPAVVSRKIGGYMDAWRVPPDPGWTVMGYMRYRSRRDMMELATDPRFFSMHPFKLAATAETFSFPTRPQLLLYLSPRAWAPLVIVLLASLVQIAALLAERV